MPFQHGHKKLGGRKKGTLDKARMGLIDRFNDVGLDAATEIKEVYHKAMESIKSQPEYMQPENYIKLMEQWTKILEFIYPRKKTVDVNIFSLEELAVVAYDKLYRPENNPGLPDRSLPPGPQEKVIDTGNQ